MIKKQSLRVLILLLNLELNEILQKVIGSTEFKSIDKIIVLQNKFNLEKLYKKYPDF
jgi:hypothetical protein